MDKVDLKAAAKRGQDFYRLDVRKGKNSLNWKKKSFSILNCTLDHKILAYYYHIEPHSHMLIQAQNLHTERKRKQQTMNWIIIDYVAMQ